MKKTGLPFDVSFNLFKEVFENVPDIAVNLLNKDFTVPGRQSGPYEIQGL